MKSTLRGRPKLNIETRDILRALRQSRKVVAAARELCCSPAYIHARLRELGLSLTEVLDAPDSPSLFEDGG